MQFWLFFDLLEIKSQLWNKPQFSNSVRKWACMAMNSLTCFTVQKKSFAGPSHNFLHKNLHLLASYNNDLQQMLNKSQKSRCLHLQGINISWDAWFSSELIGQVILGNWPKTQSQSHELMQVSVFWSSKYINANAFLKTNSR